MPKLDKAERREKKRQKKNQMKVDGRGLITSPPNLDRRIDKAKRAKKRRRKMTDDYS